MKNSNKFLIYSVSAFALLLIGLGICPNARPHNGSYIFNNIIIPAYAAHIVMTLVVMGVYWKHLANVVKVIGLLSILLLAPIIWFFWMGYNYYGV